MSGVASRGHTPPVSPPLPRRASPHAPVPPLLPHAPTTQMATYQELPKEEMVEVPISPPAAAAAPRPACLFTRCCGCFSLATGVAILAYFDLFSGLSSLFVATGLLYGYTHEHAVDHALVKLMGNATAAVAQQKVEQFNAGLDFAAAASPLILLSALVALVAGAYGLKAARGCASSAHKFYAWKLACAVWAVLGGLLGRGSSVFQVALAVYFALVTRSFWLKLALLEASLGELPTSAPAPLPADAQRELLGYEKAKEEAAAAAPAVANTPIVYVGIIQK